MPACRRPSPRATKLPAGRLGSTVLPSIPCDPVIRLKVVERIAGGVACAASKMTLPSAIPSTAQAATASEPVSHLRKAVREAWRGHYSIANRGCLPRVVDVVSQLERQAGDVGHRAQQRVSEQPQRRVRSARRQPQRGCAVGAEPAKEELAACRACVTLQPAESPGSRRTACTSRAAALRRPHRRSQRALIGHRSTAPRIGGLNSVRCSVASASRRDPRRTRAACRSTSA